MVKFFTTMEIVHIAVICSVLLAVNCNEVDVSAKGSISVRPTEEADLMCTTSVDILRCTFISPYGTTFSLVKDLTYEGNRLSFLGDNEKRECGLKINKVEEKDNGEWRCEILSKGADSNAVMGSNGISLTVLKAPKSVSLDVAPNLSLVEADVKEQKIRCTAEGGYPAPAFSWTLDDAPAKVEVLAEDKDGESSFYQEILYKTRKEDNGKVLKCVVSSEAYTADDLTSGINTDETELDIQYKPESSKDMYEFYEMAVGESYDVRISFRANPKPSDLTWVMHDGIEVPQNSADLSGKYQSNYAEASPVDDGEMFTAKLTINSVTPEDAGTENLLRVKNDYGETEIKFKLTLGEKPAAGKTMVVDGMTDENNTDQAESGTGPVIAIVIIILIIIVVVAVAVVARSQGLLCFAVPVKGEGEDKEKAVEKEEGSDTESAEHQTEPAKTETDGEAETPAKKSLPARMTSLLSVMKKTVGGSGKKSSSTTGPTESEELKQAEDKPEESAEDKKDDIVYADLDKSAMSEGNITVSVENEKTEYAEIKTN